jgi:hemolysin activation/secretion protein
VGIVILASEQQFSSSGVPVPPNGGVLVRGVSLLDTPELQGVVAPYLGKAATINSLRQLEEDIVRFCRKRDRPIVDVSLPLGQDVSNGVVQLVITEGKVNQVTVEHEGTGKHWFSDDFIRSQVRLKPGDSISEKLLLQDVNWLNQNPFRDVSVNLRQGEQESQTDVALRMVDRFPLRVYAGYEDSGSRIAGGVSLTNGVTHLNDMRLLFGFNWGNAFGLDHQLNYQYMADTDFNTFSAHSGSYIIPLPWRHTLTFLGSYVDARGNVADVSQHGISSDAAMKYSIPLTPIGDYQHGVTLGFDYKNSDDLVTTAGQPVAPTANTDLGQFLGGYYALNPDRWGSTSFEGDGFISPGWVGTANSYQAARPFAKRDYVYGRFSAERDTRLPFSFTWVLRGVGQVSDRNLLVSEQFGLGGYATVRGYDEREANGDQGWFVSNELRTPALSLMKRGASAVEHIEARHDTYEGVYVPDPNARWRRPIDQFQMLAFWDYGVTGDVKLTPGEAAHTVLSSVGVGFRYTITRFLTMRFDYGWQLRDDPNNPDHSRAHVGVTASF